MKKVILMSVLSLLTATNNFIFATCLDTWTKCAPETHPGNYKTADVTNSPNGTGGYDWTLDCEGDGAAPCTWNISNWDGNMALAPDQVDQAVADQISIGNLSGQIYNDGSTGSYTIQTVGQDPAGKPCFLWQISYDANNNQILTIMVTDEGTGS